MLKNKTVTLDLMPINYKDFIEFEGSICWIEEGPEAISNFIMADKLCSVGSV